MHTVELSPGIRYNLGDNRAEREIASIQSTEASNEIKGIRTTHTRLKLVGDKSPAIEAVRRAVERKLGKTSVEGSRKKLVDQGVLIQHGKGWATCFARAC